MIDGLSPEVTVLSEFEMSRESFISEARGFHNEMDERIRSTGVFKNENPGLDRPLKVTRTDAEALTPTYHNWNHVEGAMDAWKDIANEYKQGNDIFGLANQVERYKEALKKEYADRGEEWDTSWDDFFESDDWIETIGVMFAGHDLGNLTDNDGGLDENGEMRFASRYLEKGAEERSILITEQLIGKHFGSYEHKDKMERFAGDMLKHTIFDFTADTQKMAEVPFWQAIQTIDQIGSGYYNKDAYALIVAGLLNEKLARGESQLRMGVSRFVHFVHGRLYSLMRGNNERFDAALNYWNERNQGKAEEILTIAKLLENRYGELNFVRHITELVNEYDKYMYSKAEAYMQSEDE